MAYLSERKDGDYLLRMEQREVEFMIQLFASIVGAHRHDAAGWIADEFHKLSERLGDEEMERIMVDENPLRGQVWFESS